MANMCTLPGIVFRVSVLMKDRIFYVGLAQIHNLPLYWKINLEFTCLVSWGCQ